MDLHPGPEGKQSSVTAARGIIPGQAALRAGCQRRGLIPLLAGCHPAARDGAGGFGFPPPGTPWLPAAPGSARRTPAAGHPAPSSA